MIKNTFLLLVILSLTACMSSQVGYFEVMPYARPGSNKIDQPAFIKISDRITNVFDVAGQGLTLHVSEFHKSLNFAVARSLGDLFTEIRPAAPGQSGFIIEVQRMEPKWEFKKRMERGERGERYEVTDMWCIMEYASTIYHNEVLISQAGGVVRPKLGENNIYKTADLFKEAVKQSCAAMAQQHYDKK